MSRVHDESSMDARWELINGGHDRLCPPGIKGAPADQCVWCITATEARLEGRVEGVELVRRVGLVEALWIVGGGSE